MMIDKFEEKIISGFVGFHSTAKKRMSSPPLSRSGEVLLAIKVRNEPGNEVDKSTLPVHIKWTA
uniref:Uncharacterized protein n=1 Tax=Parascaris univalens TaxID=6257 RepID=A0A914ZRG1_PARUN